MIRFSIITPTIQRQSLIAACESVNSQSYENWEHLIQVDRRELNSELMAKIAHPKRTITQCDVEHRDGGNTCRGLAWERAVGQYCYYLDCDNFLADADILADIDSALISNPAWAVFPITRLGGRFFSDPPRSCHTDTLNLVFRHEYAQWPKTDAYGSDGVMVEDLIGRGIPYTAYPDFRPIAVLPKISFCKED
jgi:hypothetical protein